MGRRIEIMLSIKEERSFRKDLKLLKKRGKDIKKLQDIVKQLAQKKPLPIKNRNHRLTGNYRGFYECHIEPDWLLIYRLEKDSLVLVRTGSHSDLF